MTASRGRRKKAGRRRSPAVPSRAKTGRARNAPARAATDAPGWHETLWSSWRMEYIARADETGCIFCDKPREADGERNLILHRGRHGFVILNAFPYNPGHVMVTPFRHVGRLGDLSRDERLDVMDLLALSHDVIDGAMRPQGVNIGINLGRVAGAGIVGHVHVHLVPRWNGDTNFMPVIGQTKVIPEGLAETYRKLRAAFAEREGKG